MKVRVLYLDDEPILLRGFKRTLEVAGMEVVVTASPTEALEQIEQGAFDVVCSDYMMPEMDGLEFLGRAKIAAPSTARIMITAYHDFDVACRAVQAGVYRIIGKPWSAEVLVANLNDAAETVRLRRENDRLNALVLHQVEELEAMNSSLDVTLAHRTDQVIDALITCLDYRDEETLSHSKRVSLFARYVAETMGISQIELGHMEWGAMLHDVGKIGVPDAILLKPGKLTEAEWVIMRRHAPIGFHMINRIDFLRGAARLVGDHHERFDGTGYPHGRVGDEIYLGARIFAVVDTFDAITSDRPYRTARTDTVAKGIIQSVSGTQLDPVCVAAFMKIPDEKWAEIREEANDWAASLTVPEEAASMSKGPGLEEVRAITGAYTPLPKG